MAAAAAIGVPIPGPGRDKGPIKRRLVDTHLEQTVSQLLGLSSLQIRDWIAVHDPGGYTGATDDRDDDDEGFDPDEDSEAEDDRGPDESEREISPWDVRDGPAGSTRQAADIVLRPGDKGKWVAVLTQPVEALGSELPVVMLEALKTRDRTILAVAQALVDQQRDYLRTLDTADLKSVTQKDVAEFAHVTPGRVSRALEKNLLELPDGQVVPLEALVADSDFGIARIVCAKFLEKDEVTRDPDGAVLAVGRMAPWEEVVRAVQSDMDDVRGRKESNVRRAARKFGLPANVKARRNAYWEGRDWWTASF